MSKARDIASAAPAPAGVTSTELGYVDGVTSAIQTQVDAKIAKTLTTTTGDIIYASGANTPARLGVGSTGNVLTVSGGVPVWSAPAGGGKVLQVVSSFKSDTFTATGNTFTDVTGLSVTITPTLSTSKILIMYSANVSSPSNDRFLARLMRGSTAIAIGDTAGNRSPVTNETSTQPDIAGMITIGMTFLDSPATTSATTYKLQGRAIDSGSTIYVNRGSNNDDFSYTCRAVSTITVMEIGA